MHLGPQITIARESHRPDCQPSRLLCFQMTQDISCWLVSEGLSDADRRTYFRLPTVHVSNVQADHPVAALCLFNRTAAKS